jgi:hypothetical protein
MPVHQQNRDSQRLLPLFFAATKLLLQPLMWSARAWTIGGTVAPRSCPPLSSTGVAVLLLQLKGNEHSRYRRAFPSSPLRSGSGGRPHWQTGLR